MTDLRALAEAATPGPWETDARPPEYPHANAVRYAGGQIQGGANVCGIGMFILHDGGQDRASMDANAAYIAAVSPDVVLDLLDEIERLQACLAEATRPRRMPCPQCGGSGRVPEPGTGEMVEPCGMCREDGWIEVDG